MFECSGQLELLKDVVLTQSFTFIAYPLVTILCLELRCVIEQLKHLCLHSSGIYPFYKSKNTEDIIISKKKNHH